MASIGAGIGNVGTSIDQPRVGTLSPFDFAYWASTFASPGTPRDYVDIGPETDAASLISWSAAQIGVSFPDSFNVAVLACSGYEISVKKALSTRGALLIGSSKFAVTLGLNDILDIVNGRYFIYRLNESQESKWITGAKLPGALY